MLCPLLLEEPIFGRMSKEADQFNKGRSTRPATQRIFDHEASLKRRIRFRFVLTQSCFIVSSI